MSEIIYWILFLFVLLFALPLIFLLGVVATGVLLTIIVTSMIVWTLNFGGSEFYKILITFSLIVVSLICIYFTSLVTFAALGFLMSKVGKNIRLLKLVASDHLYLKKNSLKIYAKFFFLSLFLLLKKTAQSLLILIPITVIVFLFSIEEFNHSELWI